MANELTEHEFPVADSAAVPVIVEPTGESAKSAGSKGEAPGQHKIEWLRCGPFLALHAAVLTVFLVGWSWTAVGAAVFMLLLRTFAITGFYHRYFSHRSFKTSRWFQFVWAFIGNMSVQKGPIWWAAHHRHHHLHSDDEYDVHSPITHSFLYSHMGWFMTDENFYFSRDGAGELQKFPELKFLDRFDYLAPVILGVCMFLLGFFLEQWPALETNRWQMLVWGFVVSTLICYHFTYSINSLAHVFGKRRFNTKDQSRNNWFLALITFGEGWHNNHHRYQSSVRQGFYWWELDITYYILVLMSWCGLVWDLTPVPEKILNEGKMLDAERKTAGASVDS
ncbi:MAG: acyl-CoA desaturase [Planctomycetaceae bacterium]|jgi:stearoyl-CoA desaturase (delta-9 desaturase)|nr:acyl-CoA desaturase [Planctomycetaceae bacterium]MCP4813316.1 acyl-CoA desaturase [Planctomycetaceae bacterium]